MIYPGLVSVTFRKLPPGEIAALAARAGLRGIEWGGDIHVPHGDISRAKEVLSLTEAYGLKVAAYGSYYEVGCNENQNFTFEQVLETAAALHAPTIRVWAGDRGSGSADAAWWDKVAGESRHIAEMAASAGITVSYEYHGNTLTDSPESAKKLLTGVNHPYIRSYWQQAAGLGFEQQLKGLNQVLPWLSNMHVFQYNGAQQLPLADGRADWIQFLKAAAGMPGHRFAMLEFVPGDRPDCFLEDAKILKNLTDELRQAHEG